MTYVLGTTIGGPLGEGGPSWFVTDWQLFPLVRAIAAEPDLKERISSKSSCEFSFSLSELEAGPKPASNQAHH